MYREDDIKFNDRIQDNGYPESLALSADGVSIASVGSIYKREKITFMQVTKSADLIQINELRTCKCSNGRAYRLESGECPLQDNCESCDDGYFLYNDKCIQCSCPSGTAGQSCTSNKGLDCVSCNDGFVRAGSDCVLKVTPTINPCKCDTTPICALDATTCSDMTSVCNTNNVCYGESRSNVIVDGLGIFGNYVVRDGQPLPKTCEARYAASYKSQFIEPTVEHMIEWMTANVVR